MGALIAGDDVTLDSQQLVNSGQLIARRQLTLTGDTLEDTGGQAQANAISATATDDITLTDSQWTARESLTLDAGRNLTLARATHSDTLTHGTRTTVGEGTVLRTTGETGQVNITAGQDMTVRGSDIINDGTGDTTLAAGGALTVTHVMDDTRRHDPDLSLIHI